MSCHECEICLAPEGYVCQDSGNFYTTGEYHQTIEFFNIHGVSFNQKIDSVKHLLDSNTIQILKVLLQDIDAPCQLDLENSLNIIATLELIQSKLSNHMDDTEHIVSDNKSYPLSGDEQ